MEYQKLSPRESTVLSYLWEGRTNREIAKELKLSVRTVEVHRFNIGRKWNVSNVAQMLKLGLLTKAIKLPKKGAMNGR